MTKAIKLQILDRADFKKYHDATSPAGLFVPLPDPLPTGTAVRVEVIFHDGPRIALRGTVRWRRTTGDSRTKPGIGVGLEESEKNKLNYILAYVRGGLLDVRRRRRLPIRLRLSYASPKGRRVSHTRDVHEEGAFIVSSEPLEVGSTVMLAISPPGGNYKPIEVRAVVLRHQGEAETGMGVRFDFPTPSERTRFSEFIQRLENDYASDQLDDRSLV